jgi:hypothetical protein
MSILSESELSQKLSKNSKFLKEYAILYISDTFSNGFTPSCCTELEASIINTFLALCFHYFTIFELNLDFCSPLGLLSTMNLSPSYVLESLGEFL